MKLLFVSHSFPPADQPLSNVGGMQRVATELYEALCENSSVDVQPLVLHATWERTHLKAPLFLLKCARIIKRLAETKSVDTILFSSMVTASMAVWRKRQIRSAGIKTAAIVHGQDVTTPFGPYQRFVPRVFDALDAVLPVSRATGEQCLQRGLPENKLHVVPNGIKLSRFAPLGQRRQMRKALMDAMGDPLPEDALLLCSVGRHVKRKGFAWFIEEVMPRLPDDVHYWLAGDGPETDAIRQAVAHRDLAGRVRLPGRISDEHLELLYRGADLFVMPNIPVPGTMEGFGVVMLEAGLGGLPAVAARLEGIQDVISEGENGHFVESGDAEGFQNTIMHYYNDRAALDSASTKAAFHTANTFGWSAVAQQYIDTLTKLHE